MGLLKDCGDSLCSIAIWLELHGARFSMRLQHRTPEVALGPASRGLPGGEGSGLSQSLPEQLSPSSESTLTQVASNSAA